MQIVKKLLWICHLGEALLLSEEGPGAQSVSESAQPSQQRFWLPRLLVLGSALLFGLVALEVLLQLSIPPY